MISPQHYYDADIIQVKVEDFVDSDSEVQIENNN